jgi:hypothetical protein
MDPASVYFRYGNISNSNEMGKNGTKVDDGRKNERGSKIKRRNIK